MKKETLPSINKKLELNGIFSSAKNVQKRSWTALNLFLLHFSFFFLSHPCYDNSRQKMSLSLNENKCKQIVRPKVAKQPPPLHLALNLGVLLAIFDGKKRIKLQKK